MKTLLLVLLISGLWTSQNAAAQTLPAEAREVLAETQGAQALADVTKATETVAATAPLAAVTESPIAKAPKAPLTESEIPLHLDKKKSDEAAGGSALRFIFGVAVLGVLLGGAWFLVRRHSKPGPRKNAPQIKVLTQHYLGPKKSLAIIRVAGESILIGVTDHNINLIKPLSLMDDEVPTEAPASFGNVMETYDNDPVAAHVTGMRGKEIEEDGEEFQMGAIGQIRDAVGRRLKNMRSFE